MKQGNLERKHPDLPFGTPNEMYSREANPRKKTNVKNRSNFILRDERDLTLTLTLTLLGDLISSSEMREIDTGARHTKKTQQR